MKCIYYLAPTPSSAHRVSDDLHGAGVDDFYVHVIAKNTLGVSDRRIHPANCLETLDLIRAGCIGAAIGFLAGWVGIGLLDYFEPFGPHVPSTVYLELMAAATLFGAWDGGLFGFGTENTKLRKFRGQIESGQVLMLVYVRRHQEAAVASIMQQAHAETALAGIDAHFINPFSAVKPAADP